MLLVIDFLDGLLPKIFNKAVIVPRAVKVIRFAHELGLFCLVTECRPTQTRLCMESPSAARSNSDLSVFAHVPVDETLGYV